MIIIGIGFVVFPIVFIFLSLSKGNRFSETTLIGAFSLLFLIIGFFLLVTGIYQFFYKEEIMITKEFVESRQVKLKKVRTWKELLSNYKGIFGEIHDYYQHESSYEIKLVHNDPKKSILLFDSSNHEYFEQSLQNFARILNLAVLKKVGDEFLAVAVDDLHKTIKEKIEEGYKDV